ncbi:class I SAM-dependent RNA methyltransferase [Kibdelosporangium aridum]|uniref:Class I SAM-dependent RNA methyltransferase n=1 Tax=Kibdelosporangium aridum TaxID=2030 RepID=A0A428XWK5_KIBAR|nr:TRAM domain-containing protein [Kibdelosporangium aridum]RSM59654.1 class I SAM-dependent RNA methyltransferase [Kibdelosporangium aridum]
MTAKEKLNWKGRRLDVEVGPVAHGGHCVARYEGRVLFVRHALPGERVTAQVTEDKGGSYCRADAVEIITASPDRVEPPCPLSGPGACGGCDWQHASGEAQRKLKAAVVSEHLSKATGRDIPVVVEELTGGLLGWRTRVRMAVGFDQLPGFHPHRSHAVIPVGHCPITVPGLVESVAGQEFTKDSELELVRDGGGRIHARQLKLVRGYRGRMHYQRKAIAGDGESAVEFAAGRHWEMNAYNFWQVHPAAADTLAAAVGEWAQASPGACAWDLYSGVGIFASVLAAQVGPEGRVLAVEQAGQSSLDSERLLADLPQVTAVSRKVEVALREGLLDGADPEVVVLDPPRKGAGHEVVDTIAGRHPARVVYVACDPAALGRDVARFMLHGYKLDSVRAFDAFPMTHHVEAVALLSPGD